MTSAVAKAAEPFTMVLELSDSMPEKLHLLDTYKDFFMGRLPSDTNSKRDLDNCILAYESAVHLTPQDHADMPGHLKDLGNY